jgi:Condensation domain/Phosphopantetheine attachment site
MPDVAAQRNKTAAERGTPLSPAQQASLLPERLHGLPTTNHSVVIEILGALDIELLQQALSAVLGDHEILRTVFPRDRRIPYQQIVPVPEQVIELAQLDTADLAARLDADANEGFELAHDIPIRVRLYETPHRRVLSIVAHPVAADERGLDLLVRALAGRYSGTHSDGTAQYRDFVKELLRSLTPSVAAKADLAYWTEHLADLPHVPRAWRAADSAEATTRREVLLDAGMENMLLAAEPDSDPAAVVAALVSAMLPGGPGEDVPIGLADAARTLPGADAVIGNFANHLVLRLSPPEGRPVRDVIRDAARVVTAARSHSGTRIEQLAHSLRGLSAYHSDPLFSVLIRVRPDNAGPLPAGWTELSRRIARPVGVDIVVDAVLTAQGMRVGLEFPAPLSKLPEIEAFVEHIGSQWREWAANPDAVVPAAPAGGVIFAEPALPPGDGLRGLGGVPITETEQMLADLLWQILDLDGDAIGREDTFFSLGGDSIAALRLVTLLDEKGYPVEVRAVFGHPVLHELAAEIDRAAKASEVSPRAASSEFAPMSASGLDDATLRALSGRFTVQQTRE